MNRLMRQNKESAAVFDFWLRMFNASDSEAIKTIAALEGIPEELGAQIEAAFHEAKDEDEKAEVLMKLFEKKGRFEIDKLMLDVC